MLEQEFPNLKQIVMDALDLPPDKREAFITQACGDNAQLLAQVRSLLNAQLQASAEGFLPTSDPANVTPTRNLDAIPEAIVGALIAERYKLLEPIGEGGMGLVWMAEQRTPVRRLVAIKLIKAGMDSRAVLARFDAERQALAMMDHPSIARVFDGGTTSRGHPWFAMELVRGLPLTQYCDDRRMNVRERLELFIQICSAVQHAHVKGIIHRDLKPSNVLVTETDGKPLPKVIDFGLAKALGGGTTLTDLTLHTSFGAVAGTPLYMAPEQVAINSLDVDTRADVYALGVMLYELLTGTTPLEKQRLATAAWDEIRRVIREEEAPRPSIRISTPRLAGSLASRIPPANQSIKDEEKRLASEPANWAQSNLTSIARDRNIDPDKLRKQLKGDLDWIVLKALEKDRNRRYETANGLAADIQRHLQDEPVIACPPTWRYRARKFARKHRVGVIAGAAVAAALAMGLGGTTWQAHRAARERNAAEEANSQLLSQEQEVTETLKRIASIEFGMDGLGGPDALFDLAKQANTDRKETGEKRITPLKILTVSAERSYQELNKRTQEAELEAYIANLALGQTAMAGQNWPEARARLDACPEAKRGWEWKFLRKQADVISWSPPSGTTRLGDFSANGSSMIVQSSVGVQVCNVVTGEPLTKLLPCQRDAVAHFSADDKLILISSKTNGLRAFDIVTGSPTFPPIDQHAPSFGTEAKGVTRVLSPDGKILIDVPESGGISAFHDATTLQPVGEPVEFVRPCGVSFASDGLHVATSSGNKITVRDVKARMHICTQIECGTNAQRVSFSGDGKRLVAFSGRNENTATVWDAVTGAQVGQPIWNYWMDDAFAVGNERVLIVNNQQYGMDGVLRRVLALYTTDGTQIGEIDSGEHVTEGRTAAWIRQLAGGASYLFIDRDDRFFVADAESFDPPIRHLGSDSQINVFDDIFNERGTIELEMQAAALEIESATAGHDASKVSSTLATLSVDGIVQSLDDETHKKVDRIGSIKQPVSAFVTSPDGSRIVAGDSNGVRFYSSTDWRQLAVFPQERAVKRLEFSADGERLLIQFADGSAQIWDPRPLAERQKMWKRRADERKPAREYVTALLAKTATTEPADLKQMIRADATITPLRKLVALEVLDLELRKRERESKRATTQPATAPVN